MPLPEKILIAHLQRAAADSFSQRQLARSAIVNGIGDDCAVLRIPSNHQILVTTDFSIEGIHFRREWSTPEQIGYRCLARGLSDIAAMGGDPVAAFLSLALPDKLPQLWADSFLKGLLVLAKKFGVPLAGGDTSSSPQGVLADIVVLGSVPKGKAILRSGARAGDRIYVTGELGGAAQRLSELYSSKARSRGRTRHDFLPDPRLKAGKILRERGIASAMIDISDGLSTDLSHLCEESGVGAEIRQNAVPKARLTQGGKFVDLGFALHGGDDYELLFTAARKTRVPNTIAGISVTEIGEITKGKSISLFHENGTRMPLKPQGWEHFRQLSPDK